MKTLAVSDVERGRPYESLDARECVRSLLAKPAEDLYCAAARLVSCDTQHAFVKAAHDAFYDHHPLVIRPDDIWFCIAQGFAAHVGQNAELLRSRFVTHQGKRALVVARPDFVLGQPNPWPEVFEAFSVQIGEYVGELKDVVSARFSTTTPVEAAAFDVCLMETFEGYFDYEVRCGCGIPEIRLLGTPEDWASMIPRVRRLAAYGLEEWGETLGAVLDKIHRAAAGEVDIAFWRSFFRYQSGSGPSELTGWIITLFPYLIVDWRTNALGRNKYLGSWKAHFDAANARTGWLRYDIPPEGPGIGAIPQALASAPLRCIDELTGLKHRLRFVAGMFGVEQDEETGALSASFGWAVIHEPTLEEGAATPDREHVSVIDEVTGKRIADQADSVSESPQMTIDPFDEGLHQRHIVPYDPAYAEVFSLVQEYARGRIEGVELVHIGSTAVVGLRGKPMVDITAITARENLREEQKAFERAGFHRRPVWVDKDEKPYVCGSVLHGGRRFNVNIHICHRGDPVHKDSLAFINILERRPDLRRKYEEAKDRAHTVDPADPQVYNREKEAVIREIEAQVPKASKT